MSKKYKNVGYIFWEWINYDEVHILTWLQLVFSVLYYVLPLEQYFEKIIGLQVDNATQQSYDQQFLVIFDDYDRRNPETADARCCKRKMDLSLKRNYQTFNKKTIIHIIIDQKKSIIPAKIQQKAKIINHFLKKVHPINISTRQDDREPDQFI